MSDESYYSGQRPVNKLQQCAALKEMRRGTAMSDYDVVRAALEGYRCVSDPLCAQPVDRKTVAVCHCLACDGLSALDRLAKDGERIDWLGSQEAGNFYWSEAEYPDIRAAIDDRMKGGSAPVPAERCQVRRGTFDQEQQCVLPASHARHSDHQFQAEQSGARASINWCGTLQSPVAPDSIQQLHEMDATREVEKVSKQPCECAARTALEEVIQTTQPIAIAFAARSMQGDDILVNVPFSAIRETAYLCGRLAKPKEGDALSAPCPCDALREENERLKSQLASAIEAHRQAEAELDEAFRTRTLAQEASTRDQEAKRAAERKSGELRNEVLHAITEKATAINQRNQLQYQLDHPTDAVLAKHQEAPRSR